jgi:hypothetical protein
MKQLKSSESVWWGFKRFVFDVVVSTSNHLFGKEIIHRSPLARWLNQKWLAMIEVISPARRRQSRFERANPDAPWFVPEAIHYIENELRPEFRGFEWGCGRSTLWFARRVAHITSIEGRRGWFEDVTCQITSKNLGDRVTLRLAEVTTEYNFIRSEIDRYAGAIDEIADASLDFIVVDGHFREDCIKRVAAKLKSGGLLIIDNTDVLSKSVLDSLSSSKTECWNNGVSETTSCCHATVHPTCVRLEAGCSLYHGSICLASQRNRVI